MRTERGVGGMKERDHGLLDCSHKSNTTMRPLVLRLRNYHCNMKDGSSGTEFCRNILEVMLA